MTARAVKAETRNTVSRKFVDLDPRVWKDSGRGFDAHNKVWAEAMGSSSTPADMTLDLGCGPGRFTLRLIGKSRHVVAADINTKMLRASREKARQFSVHDELSLVACDAQRLPFRDNSFDIVNMIGTLVHLPDQAASLREISRVAKVQGRVVVDHTNFLSFGFFLDVLLRLLQRIFSRGVKQHSLWPYHRRCSPMRLMSLVRGTQLRVERIHAHQVFPILNTRVVPMRVSAVLDDKIRNSPLKFLGYVILIVAKKAFVA